MRGIDDDVVQLAFTQRVANGMSFGTHPMIRPRILDQVGHFRIGEKRSSRHKNAVRHITGILGLNRSAVDDIADSRFDAVRANN